MLCDAPDRNEPDQEDDDRELEQQLAAVDVAELAVERHGRRRRQQVGRDHPREVLQAAEVADDRRQRRRDDRLVERREQHAEHQPAEDDQHLAVRELALPFRGRVRHRDLFDHRAAPWAIAALRVDTSSGATSPRAARLASSTCSRIDSSARASVFVRWRAKC